jgi:pilus assembly protein CpaC
MLKSARTMSLAKTFKRLRAIVAAALLSGGAIAVALPAVAASSPVYLRIPHKSLGSTQTLAIEVNKSVLVDLPTNAGEVIASQPAVATVVMRSKTRAIVQGVSSGSTNIFFLDAAGNSIAVLDLRVAAARSGTGEALEAAISRNIPGSRIRVESVSDGDGAGRLVLTGSARSQDDLNKAIAMATQFAGGADNIASIATVDGSQQVMLQVVVAEVQRDAVKQFGINLNGSITVGAVSLGLNNTPQNGLVSGVSNSNGFSASASGPNWSLDASLRALERRGALKTLARPTLTAISGQPAEFKAGGEFPYERVVDGQSSTEFKEYGVFLNFTPTVKSNGLINLLVDTAVKEPTGGGGISNRSAKSTVELPAGQTLAIAGMLQDTVRQQINQLPGLGNIPVLGALFRSRDFIRSQTELVILVTPYYAASADYEDFDKPTDHMKVASDAEAIFLGRMEKLYGVGDDGMRGSYSGSVGFVLD